MQAATPNPFSSRVTFVILLLAVLFALLVLGGGWLEHNLGKVARAAERARQRFINSELLRRLRGRYPRLTRFVAARFARGEYLGLHLTVGFLISLTGLWIFSAIMRAVIHEAAITRTDMKVYEWLHTHATLTGYGGWSVLSSLGSGLAITVIGVGVAGLLAYRRRWIVLGGWTAALVGGGLLDGALKLAIRRPRPPTALDFLSHLSWSFPSGHSMGSLIAYGMVAYLLVLALMPRRGLQAGVVAAATLLVLSIGLSRMYLGVHYFSDVMGGFAAGVLWLSACISGLEVARRLKARAPAAAARPAPPA